MKIQLVICLLVLIAALSGCTGPGDKPATVNQTPAPVPRTAPTPAFPVPEPSTVYVEIFGSKFSPPRNPLNIINGTTVQWTNKDSSIHTVNLTINGESFSSPPLDNVKSKTWNFTFNKTGTFEYSCSNHPWMQHGRIIVE